MIWNAQSQSESSFPTLFPEAFEIPPASLLVESHLPWEKAGLTETWAAAVVDKEDEDEEADEDLDEDDEDLEDEEDVDEDEDLDEEDDEEDEDEYDDLDEDDENEDEDEEAEE